MIALRVAYLISPVVFAGAMHAIFLKHDLLGKFAHPIDGGRDIFGANKTWRGPFLMVAGCTAVVSVQSLVDVRGLALVDYGRPLTLALGPALGLGYSLGELPNSFLKRRIGIEPGRRAERLVPLQYVADQGDSVLGAALAVALFVGDPLVLVLVISLGFAFHAVFDRLLYVFHVKEAL